MTGCLAVVAVISAPLGPARAQRVAPPITDNAVPQGSPIPRILPSQPPPVGQGLPTLPPVQPSPLVPNTSVRVSSVAVEGATAYPQGRLTQLTAGLTGPAVPVARIDAARLAILNLYRADGYALTTVAAAVDAAGRLRFTVLEGRIADVRLEGDIGPAGTQVLRFLHHLTETRPIDTATLERWLLLAQDVPGVTLHAVLRPSTDEPGALTLIAQVQRKMFDGLFTLDNRAFRLTGPQEGLLVLDANSFTEFGERTELSLYKSAADTQTFGQGAFETFVGGSGAKIRVYFGEGDSTPSDFLHAIGYQGFTTVFGASASYPVIRSRQQTLNVAAYFDVIESEIRTASGPNGAEVRASRDSLRVARVGADYVRQDLLLGDPRPAVNDVSVRLSQGINGLGSTSGSNPLPGRVGENISFTKFSGELVRTQTLFEPWPGSTIALKGLLTGQYSGDILPPAEKFYLGGIEFDRGFYSGEVTGDSAYAWSLELQLNTGFDFTVFNRPIQIATQFYAFYDRGEAWQNTSAEPNARLSSEGIGVRMNVTRYTEFDLEGVIRNTRLPSGTPGSVSALKADALYWRVLARF
ncbi:MAG: ShlB/FhaC/HecB family hemolysin secretion/activation protein [Acidisphaera sp.]|nr:ShlB/FhaC/HecB family hemolysin secretion/activation protein [Acidisphaera sp.]